jgi:hypothetical protein
MRYMVVTLEVSQPEMSALKFVKYMKSWLMSVMAETHQSAMGPYFAMAEAAFELNSLSAVFRESLVVKVSPMQASEGEGGSGEGDEDEGGGGEGGGAGQLPVEGHQPEPVRAPLLKAAVPAHAQRMSSLLASDKARFAFCRSRKGGVFIMGGEVRAGRRERGYEAAATACTLGARLKACMGPGHTRGAHVEHAVHGRDAGGVKAQRLVEGRRLLPSRREGTCDARGGEVRAGRREGLGW